VKTWEAMVKEARFLASVLGGKAFETTHAEGKG
jgi:hypothetical protein